MSARLRTAVGLVAIVMIVGGCVVEARPRPPPPRLLSSSEAVAIATEYARSRGLVIDYTHAVRLDRRARWHVDLGGARGRDRAAVLVDGYSGGVLGARLRGPRGEYVPQPPPGGAYEPPPPMPPEPSAPPPPPPEAPPAPPAR